MVVIGAGFAGLAAASALSQARVEVIVVDRHNYHLFSPLLYQVATALLDPAMIAHPVRGIRRFKNMRFCMGEVQGVDFDQRLVQTDRGQIAYDFLILAAGAESNYFGNRSFELNSFGLKEPRGCHSIARPCADAIRKSQLGGRSR